MRGWRACLLSRGGRLILMKAVLAGIPIYYMSIFMMTAGVSRRLEKIMRSFLTQGGLGIRHLQHTNMALLAKCV